MPLHHRDNEESQVRGERQTLIWCLIMDVKEVHSAGSSCIPSIEILLEVCVLPSNIQKKLSFWTGTSLIILLQICNMKQMNCSAFWIALQFIFISLWNTSLNRQHTFLSNLWSFSVPYVLVVLIFLVKRYIPHALVYKFHLDFLGRSSNDSIKISCLCEGSQIAHWRKHWMSRN